MVPTQALIDAVAAAIAADEDALAAAAFLHVYLVSNNFVPGNGLVVDNLVKATFTGSTAKVTTSATMQTFRDAQTGEWIIQIPEPAGGWHWQTGDAVNLPQTIYGYALTNVGETTLWGTALLPSPILLNGAGQGIDIAQVRFRLSQLCLS
jgi:hypothetical protein